MRSWRDRAHKFRAVEFRSIELWSTGLRSAVVMALLSLGSPAHATYSLIAVDTDSREMAGVVISCIGTDLSLSEVVRLDEEHIIAAQGYFFTAGRDELISRLKSGLAPSEAIGAALTPNIDPAGTTSGPTYRQYAALNLDGEGAQHSGAHLLEFAGHLSGTVGTISYALQGNILSGIEVLDELERGFSVEGTDIASRIVSALSTLNNVGGGDARCAPRSGDAGYFAYRTPHAPLLEIELVDPEDEVARALAKQIEASGAVHVDSHVPSKTPNNPAEAAPGKGCEWSPAAATRGAVLALSLLGGLGLLFRRRARTFGS